MGEEKERGRRQPNHFQSTGNPTISETTHKPYILQKGLDKGVTLPDFNKKIDYK